MDRSALMLVSGYAQCPRCVTLLLRHGAQVNLRSRYGYGALTFARQHRESGPDRDNHEVIALLQKAGAKE